MRSSFQMEFMDLFFYGSFAVAGNTAPCICSSKWLPHTWSRKLGGAGGNQTSTDCFSLGGSSSSLPPLSCYEVWDVTARAQMLLSPPRTLRSSLLHVWWRRVYHCGGANRAEATPPRSQAHVFSSFYGFGARGRTVPSCTLRWRPRYPTSSAVFMERLHSSLLHSLMTPSLPSKPPPWWLQQRECVGSILWSKWSHGSL